MEIKKGSSHFFIRESVQEVTRVGYLKRNQVCQHIQLMRRVSSQIMAHMHLNQPNEDGPQFWCCEHVYLDNGKTHCRIDFFPPAPKKMKFVIRYLVMKEA